MQKRIWTPLMFLLVSALFIGVAFAATKWIGRDGGVIKIRNGVELVIPSGALEKNIKIHAHMSSRQIIDEKGLGRKLLVFTLEPSGTKFKDGFPAELHIDKKFLEEENVDDIVICDATEEEDDDEEKDDDDEEETPYVEDNGDEVIIYIDHFSYYYHRRR